MTIQLRSQKTGEVITLELNEEGAYKVPSEGGPFDIVQQLPNRAHLVKDGAA